MTPRPLASGGARARGLALQRHMNTYLPLPPSKSWPPLKKGGVKREPLLPPTEARVIRPFACGFQHLYFIQHMLPYPYGAGKSIGLSSLPRKSGIAGENVECREMSRLLESFLYSLYHHLNTENSLILVRFAHSELCLCKLLLWFLGL